MINKILYEIKRKVHQIFHLIAAKILSKFHKYFVHPIALRTLKIRCGQAKRGDIRGLWERYIRMQTYIYFKHKKEYYKKHMEAIVHMSEDYNIPQHALINRYDPNKNLLIYKAKNGKTYGNDPNS